MRAFSGLGAIRRVLLGLATLCCYEAAFAAGQADFDGDGFADLAIGVPGRTVGGNSNAGAVIVLYGSAAGLSGAGAQLWHQNVSGIEDVAETGDHFGASLAWGDLNGDEFTDVVVGVPDEDFGVSLTDDGVVQILYGSAAGLTSAGDQIFSQNDTGTDLENEDGDRFGAAVAVGDFGGDGYGDLVGGAPGEDSAVADEGAIAILDGSANGLSSTGSQAFYAVTFVVPTPSTRFGHALSTGDFDGNGRADLAIGLPGHDHSGSMDAGMAVVAYGVVGGITFSGADLILQNTGNGADATEMLGFSLAAGDFDNNGKDDLAVGVPGQKISGKNAAGEVAVFVGTSMGLNIARPKFWNQDTKINGAAIKDKAEENDQFGQALASGDFNGDSRDDLAIGVPLENNKNEDGVTTNIDAGQIQVLNGSASGLTAVGNRKIGQGSNGIGLAANENGDRFGATLATGDFNHDGKLDLAIGIPLEDVVSTDEGAVMTIHGSATGLSKPSHRVFTQQSLGLAGAGAGDKMGGGVYGI